MPHTYTELTVQKKIKSNGEKTKLPNLLNDH